MQVTSLAHHDHSGSVNGIVLYGQKRLVRMIQVEDRSFGLHADLRSYAEKVLRVFARHVGHAAHLPLAPQEPVIIERWYAIEMNRIDGYHAAFAQRTQCRDDYIATGSKRHCSIQFDRRLVGLTAHPDCAQRLRELAVR